MTQKTWILLISATVLIAAMGVLALLGDIIEEEPRYFSYEPVVHVTAAIETEPVLSRGDAADDAVVWYNAEKPQNSLIIGTDKQRGLVVYNLQGEVVQVLDHGSMNNVDLRDGFPLDNERVPLVTASDQTRGAIAIYKIDTENLRLANVEAHQQETVAPYGCCMYRSKKTGKFYYFVNSRKGDIQQWELFDNGEGKVDASHVRSMSVRAWPEGCVADDDLGYFYIAEQEFGIWKFGAEPTDSIHPELVDHIGPGGVLDRQIEGLDIYYKNDREGYLIASNQGRNDFVVYTREGRNTYVTTFKIVSGNGIDEVTHTDGIAVSSKNLGPGFPQGLLVVQDHINNNYNQNFKLVPWHTVERAMHEGLPLSNGKASIR